jgi:hypothetical protein
MKKRVVAAGVVCAMLAAFGMRAWASQVSQGGILIGTGGGCAKSPDCTLFRITCDPAVAPLNGTTAAIVDVGSYGGRTIRITKTETLVSPDQASVFVEGMSDDCSQLTGMYVTDVSHPLSIHATFRYLVLTASLGAVRPGYAIEVL